MLVVSHVYNYTNFKYDWLHNLLKKIDTNISPDTAHLYLGNCLLLVRCQAVTYI